MYLCILIFLNTIQRLLEVYDPNLVQKVYRKNE